MAALRIAFRGPSEVSVGWRRVGWVSAVLALCCALYPTDHALHHAEPRQGNQEPMVLTVENGLRHVNTAALAVLPLVKRDLVGMAQVVAVTVVGTAATHGPKRLMNDWTVAGTRLGQRPLKPESKGNVPSGHASLASCGAWFACRRYGWHWAWSLVPIAAATMWARVMLDEHTVSAVLSGLFVGLAVVALFVTPWRPRDASVTSSANRDGIH